MDALIAAAGHALATGDLLGALKRVALREDPPALALRGIAMAQLGDFPRARTLLKQAARGFGTREPVARARCMVAEAEIALVSRELASPEERLAGAREVLDARGDRINAIHARHLQARRLLLLGRVDAAEALLGALPADALPPALHAAQHLIQAGIAMRRMQPDIVRGEISRARLMAAASNIPALAAEVEAASTLFEAQSARLIARQDEQLLSVDGIGRVLSSDRFIVDACRNAARRSGAAVTLSTRPVLFALLRTLAEAWPEPVGRDILLSRAFGARFVDESHRARLRVEIARLRAELGPLAGIEATSGGFVLRSPRDVEVAVLAPLTDERHGDLLALLADGEAWSSSALALALGTSARTVQRALETLSAAGKVQSFGHGPARRWITPPLPGFPTLLLLPGPLPGS